MVQPTKDRPHFDAIGQSAHRAPMLQNFMKTCIPDGRFFPRASLITSVAIPVCTENLIRID
jgi:hypothetical protein